MKDAHLTELFKPSRQEKKAKGTHDAARSIVESEALARNAKTARLRAARLASEAQAEPPKRKVAKKAVRKARP